MSCDSRPISSVGEENNSPLLLLHQRGAVNHEIPSLAPPCTNNNCTNINNTKNILVTKKCQEVVKKEALLSIGINANSNINNVNSSTRTLTSIPNSNNNSSNNSSNNNNSHNYKSSVVESTIIGNPTVSNYKQFHSLFSAASPHTHGDRGIMMSKQNHSHSSQSHNHSLGPNLGTSVVPDLMRVYESLTQSSTPQDNNASSATASSTTRAQSRNNNNNSNSNSNSNNSIVEENSDIDQSCQPQDPPDGSHHSQQVYNNNASYEQAPSNDRQPLPFLPTAPGPKFNQHNQQQQQQQQYNALEKQQYSSTQQSSQNRTSTTSSESTITTTAAAITTTTKSKRYNKNTLNKRPCTTKMVKTQRKRKKGEKDGRWSKRFAWPDELHRDFVSSVFDVGLKHSSPSTILEQMKSHDEQITSERVKSHLQKYRLHRQKSKKESIENYDATMLKMKNEKMDCDDIDSLNFAEVAAHLSYQTMHDGDQLQHHDATSFDYQPISSLIDGGVLHLPKLSEEEKMSPIGASMGYLMGLFFSLKKQLLSQRSKNSIEPMNHLPIPNINDVSYDSNQSSALVVATSASTPHTPHVSNQYDNINDNGHHNNQQHNNILSQYNPNGIGTNTVDEMNPNYYQHEQQTSSGHSAYQVTPPLPPLGPSTQQSHQDQQHQHQHQSYYPELYQQQQQQQQQQDPFASTITQESHTGGGGGGISESAYQPAQEVEAKNNTHHNASSMEESLMMKRDMRSQMAFQNKMRKLKEQELSKYLPPPQSSNNLNNNHAKEEGNDQHTIKNGNISSAATANAVEERNNVSNTSHSEESAALVANKDDGNFYDVIGEVDIDDDQLFDFLLYDMDK